MKNKKPFKVGDKIIDFGQVCRIFKIKKEKNAKGKNKKVIFFRPYFKTRQNRTLVCSIPVNNIKRAKIRGPISKKKLRELSKELSKEADVKKPINTTRLREMLRLNEVHKTAQVLKTLWLDKKDESTTFTKIRKDIFSLAMKRLVEEVAFVNRVSLGKARKQIKTALKKGVKNDGDKET